MKKLMMTVALMSMALMLAASHPNPSELTISLHDGAFFTIAVGNQSFNQQRTSYTISDLRPGRHFVEIVRYDRFFNGRFFVLGAPRVVFANYINVPARKYLVAHIDHRNRFVVTEQVNIRSHPMPGRGRPEHVRNVRQGPLVMSHGAFTGLLNTLENTRFESQRFDIARHAIASNLLRSTQVLDIIKLFSFESNRLELAKFAYAYTIDPQNYFLVHDELRLSSSRELNRFIAANF